MAGRARRALEVRDSSRFCCKPDCTSARAFLGALFATARGSLVARSFATATRTTARFGAWTVRVTATRTTVRSETRRVPMDYADDDYYGDDDSSVDDEPYANEEAVQGMITKWSPPKPIEIAAFNPATADDGVSDDETDPLRLVQKARRENKALHDFCSDQLKTIDAALTINQRLRIAAEEAQAERENWLKTRTKSRETPVRPTVIITPRDSNGSATPPPDGDSAAAAGPSNLAMTLPASSSSTALSTNLRPLPQRTEDAQRRAALAAAVPVRPAAERRSRRWTNQECARGTAQV